MWVSALSIPVSSDHVVSVQYCLDVKDYILVLGNLPSRDVNLDPNISRFDMKLTYWQFLPLMCSILSLFGLISPRVSVVERKQSQRTAMAMRIRDFSPTIRAAGKVHVAKDHVGITAELTQPDVPPTPKHVAPFRKSFQARVGCAARHFGSRNDPMPPEDMAHGIHNEYASSAEECLRAAANFKGLSAISAENAEKKYLRNRKEPLGASAEPVYELPEKTKKDNFAFGIASDKSENAKVVIYNCGQDRDNEKISSTDPGRQKDRKYDWAKVKIDPTKVRFGRASSADGITTKELFQPPMSTHVLPRIVQQHSNISKPPLGQTRNLGFGTRSQTKEYTYGLSKRRNDMGTRLLIGGSGVAPEPDDPTLGRPVCRSATLRRLREKDEAERRAKDPANNGPDRAFGCPSVRLDLPRPKYRKVTNPNNYGDEATGGSLLYPNPHGVDEELFLQPLTMESMRSLLKKSGCPGVTEEQLEDALVKCFKGNKDGTETLQKLHHILDEYTE